MRKSFFFLISFFILNLFNCQTKDSLWKEWLDSSQNDTLRLDALKKIIVDYYIFNQPDSVPYFTRIQYDFANSKNIYSHMFSALNNEGVSYYLQGEYEKAIEYYRKASSVLKITNDYKSLGANYSNMGLIYFENGKYFKAIDNLNQSVFYEDSAGNLKGKAASYSNLGIIYRSIYEDSIASVFYNKSIKVRREIGDSMGVSNDLINIGLIFYDKKLYEDAYSCFNQALVISQQNNFIQLKSKILLNIGLIFLEKKKFIEAENYFNNSYQIQKKLNDKQGMSSSLNEIANIHLELQDYKMAIKYGMEAIEIAEQIENTALIKNISIILSNAYVKNLEYKKGYYYLNKWKKLSQSFSKSNKTKEILIALEKAKYESEKKEIIKNHKNEKEHQDIKFKLEQKNKNLQQNSLIVVVVIILAFAIFWFYRLRISNEQNKLIDKQKQIVDISNREMLASINYAQRIQEALLKAKEHVCEHLPDNFVLFKPKDIVSGDFYWYSEKNGFIYIAVADCTGHGVPGAMLSMLGISYLNEIISSQELLTPAKILDLLKAKVVNELSQIDSSITVADGMDISLLRMNPKTGDVFWSGANNPLYIFSNSELKFINSTKQSIGYSDNVIPFIDHQISHEPNAIYYLFSDGYIDQFGGAKGKKLKQSGFKKKLYEIAELPLENQLTILENYFEDWKGDFDQIDDVTVLAVKSPELDN
jgi:serine phosphatase RsbU (regulator of sigma subunit)/tetratricopeptide (TPR) repeat protein